MADINESNRTALNNLLQKTAGNITNLSGDELQQLRRLVSFEIAEQYRQIASVYYKDKHPIGAMLHEEMHKRRITQYQLCHLLGIGREYLNKILGGKTGIGVQTARRIHVKLGVDANYILENV